MATTDANGIRLIEESDPLTPVSALINASLATVSTAITGIKDGIANSVGFLMLDGLPTLRPADLAADTLIIRKGTAVEVARNHHPNPLPHTADYWNVWPGFGGAATVGIVAGPVGHGHTVFRATWTTASTARGGIFTQIPLSAAAGQPFTVTIKTRSSAPKSIAMSVVGINAALTIETGAAYPPQTTTDTTTKELKVDFEIWPDTAYLSIRLYSDVDAFAVGDWQEAFELMVGNTEAYFDGSYSPDPALSPKWAGAVGGSESVLYSAPVSVHLYDGTIERPVSIPA